MSACADPDAAGPTDTADSSHHGDTAETSDATPAPSTARFLGIVLTDELSPHGIAGARVSWLEDPDGPLLTTDTFGFFEADVPNDRPLAWFIQADGYMDAIVVLPAQLADSDSHYPMTLRTPAQLAQRYAAVAATGAPEPVAGRAHVLANGGYPQFFAWAGGLTVTADTQVVYPPWDADPPAAPLTRADQDVPYAWLPNIDPATDTLTFTMRDRFENACNADPFTNLDAPLVAPVRADTITTVTAYCRFPSGHRPLHGHLVESTEEDFRVTQPAVGVEVCVFGDSACATTDTEGNFYLPVKDEPIVTLKLAVADELPVLWPRARPATGWFDARVMFRALNPTPTGWTNNFPPKRATRRSARRSAQRTERGRTSRCPWMFRSGSPSCGSVAPRCFPGMDGTTSRTGLVPGGRRPRGSLEFRRVSSRTNARPSCWRCRSRRPAARRPGTKRSSTTRSR